jgi:hypothetical protein
VEGGEFKAVNLLELEISIMKTIRALAVLTIGAICAASTFAQAQRPQRPAGTYGKGGQRPADAPQRPAGTYGNGGQRPADGPQRPAGTYGKGGERPADAPQRPAGTYGRPGGK